MTSFQINTSLVIELEISNEVQERKNIENKTWRWVGRRLTRTSLGRFDGLCRWVEWDKVALGVFFPSGWYLMDCVGGSSGIKWR